MKIVRNISAVLMAVIMLLPLSSVAFADGTTGMTFTSVSGGMKLSSFSSTSSASQDVVIPEKYNGKDVIEIGSSAFSSKGIKSVSIPATVIKIGELAFRDCYNLSTVEFTGNPSSLTLGAEVFNGCNNLASINIPGCVKAIPNEAFRDCVSLTSVNLPSGLKTIGKEAFKHCSSLTSVSIPSSVDSIGENAFYNCDKITSFSVSSGNTAYKSSGGCLLSADGNKLIQYPNGKSGSSFSVPSGVAEIGNGAFAFTSLSSVTLPSSVTSIGDDAFANAASLSSVNLPSGLTSIGCRAFLNCTSLRSITIPSSVTEYEEAFVGSGLETVTLEKGIKEISPTAFEDCKSLRSIVIPDGVTSIGYG
ncbi:MAG: leucine-rich repeat domain-containing protein, partial [Clostridia bacterium]|nr:leucine-rich repeat domain-containing protein [Clostridia bacterium]